MSMIFTMGFSAMLILRPALHSQEVSMYPHQVLLQWYLDRVRVCRVSLGSSVSIRVLLPVFWEIATPDRLAVPKASAAARQHLQTLLVPPHFPGHCVKPVLLVFLMERFSASGPA